MFRLIALFALMPTLAAAEWSPRPLMFSYEATFARCTADPSMPDLGAACFDILTASYALKRAVAEASVDCNSVAFDTCDVPFAEKGLPATAARIAFDTGCDASDIKLFPASATLPQDHCVTVTSDILSDEGVVPLQTNVACRPQKSECIAINRLNANLWRSAIRTLSDSDTTTDRVSAVSAACRRDNPAAMDLYTCQVNEFAAIWADLSQHQRLEN